MSKVENGNSCAEAVIKAFSNMIARNVAMNGVKGPESSRVVRTRMTI